MYRNYRVAHSRIGLFATVDNLSVSLRDLYLGVWETSDVNIYVLIDNQGNEYSEDEFSILSVLENADCRFNYEGATRTFHSRLSEITKLAKPRHILSKIARREKLN